MIRAIVCLATLAASPPAAPAADAAAPPGSYLEARAKAGRSPEDQVRLALWCEARGLDLERARHLSLALLADPNHPAARGLIGLVAYQGRWLRPEVVAERALADRSLAEYEGRRLDAPETADGQWALALWADEHGLKDQSRAHLIAATRLDPDRADAWKRLGYARHGGRWVTDDQVAAERAEATAQKLADIKWRPYLERYRGMLNSSSPTRRQEAEAALLAVTDPRAVATIGRVFANSPGHQGHAVRLLGQVQTAQSSRALAYLAVSAQDLKARVAATETLRGRDPREYADILINMLADPVRFEVKHVDGPGSPGEILVEGKKANLRRLYRPPSVFLPGDRLEFDRLGRAYVVREAEPSEGSMFVGEDVDAGMSRVNGMTRREVEQALPIIQDNILSNSIRPTTKFTFLFGPRLLIPMGQMAAEAQKSAVATEKQLREDVRMLEDHNAAVLRGNDQVAGVLNAATGQSLPATRTNWGRWWVDRIGYASASSDWTARPAQAQVVAIDHVAPLVPENAEREIYDYSRRSCFAAGTPVRTVAGPRAIETLQVGDLVLTQDTASGALGYHPVLKVHRNPPSPTFRVALRGRSIVASPFHRFWVAGQGWAMARDLKAGDRVRTLEGVSPVESIEADAVQPVFNLDVDRHATFFAGDADALVHDNTPPDPRATVFDAARNK